MADRHIEVTRQSWGSRLMGSIGGMVFGVILFLLSFVVLWTNEGRTDISKIADDSIPVSATQVDAANNGKLVAASGTLETSEPLGDGQFLAAGPYVYLERDVEMYAWVEHTDSETRTNLGGSTETTTEYTYSQEWTARPRAASNFQVPEGHENPTPTIEDASYTMRSANVGVFRVDPERMSLPSSRPLTLKESDLAGEGRVEGGYLYLGDGSLQSPKVGDVRISYRMVPSGIQVTAFGEQQGDSLVPYLHRGKDRLYSMHSTDRESAIAGMASAHKTTGWLLRFGGFLMMWFGLTLVMGPVSTFLDVLPILGRLSRTMLGVVAFGIALVLSLITIVISVIAHNIFALIILLAIVLGGAWLIGQRRRATTPAVA